MNFQETYQALALTLAAGAVPLIIGESGIGKTALIKSYCQKEGLYLINIDANLLKEGEIGGLPTVEAGRTQYATHHKLAEMEAYLNSHTGGCLLFIDEINRSDHAVQQELMNLILNREINGFRLDDRVRVAAAMNPSSRMEEYRDTRYQVVEMDPAQENRFVFFPMDSDAKEWIRWGLGEGEIHPRVVEFISTFEEHLHAQTSEDYIEATPRSWERISQALKVVDEGFPKDSLYHFVRGNVGSAIAQDFMVFLKETQDPFLTAQEIFRSPEITSAMKDRLAQGSHSRLYILAMNAIKELSQHGPEGPRRLGELLLFYPRDLRISIMKEIKGFYPEAYARLREEETFLEAFYHAFR